MQVIWTCKGIRNFFLTNLRFFDVNKGLQSFTYKFIVLVNTVKFQIVRLLSYNIQLQNIWLCWIYVANNVQLKSSILIFVQVHIIHICWGNIADPCTSPKLLIIYLQGAKCGNANYGEQRFRIPFSHDCDFQMCSMFWWRMTQKI